MISQPEYNYVSTRVQLYLNKSTIISQLKYNNISSRVQLYLNEITTQLENVLKYLRLHRSSAKVHFCT